MEHHELVQEMPSIERMATQDRLKHARKRRSTQLKRWGQYDKNWDKESTKKKKKHEAERQNSQKPARRKKSERVRFIANIALLESAARNDLEEVRRLLQSHVSPDVTNEDGLTALHQCCIDDNEEMLKLLLEYGGNVNACDSEMWTPLHAAATCGHVTLCKHLIDRGAELLAVNADGNMPYDICEDEVTLDYIETEMAKRGITQEQIDDTRLTTERQMLNDIKEFASNGGDLEIKDNGGASLLHIAAANGYLDVADFLLDNHVTVDTRDPESWQPIHAAAYWGQLDILEMLVHNGADLDSKTKNGEAPFDLCEDPDIKQRILDMKDEIETNRASRSRSGSARKPKHQSSRNASMRRSSVRGEKSNLFKKEAQEEALHFGLRLMQDDDDLMEVDEEKENLPATNIDDVTLSFEELDHKGHKRIPPSTNSKPDINRYPESAPISRRLSNVEPPVIESRDSIPPVVAPRAGGHHNGQPADSLSTNHYEDVEEIPERDQRKNAVDAQLQSMFLDSVPNRRHVNAAPSQQEQRRFYPPPMMDRAKNGHNNNNNLNVSSQPPVGTNFKVANSNSAITSSFRDREGPLRRFVSPPNEPIVGGDEENKKGCCVIL